MSSKKFHTEEQSVLHQETVCFPVWNKLFQQGKLKVSRRETKCFFKMHKDNATMLKIK